MNNAALEKLISYIPVLDSNILKEAPSIYVSTGTFVPPIDDLRADLIAALEPYNKFDWKYDLEIYQRYLQDPQEIHKVDADMAEKLITLAATADNFNKSLFPELCSSGFILQLLRRLRSLSS